MLGDSRGFGRRELTVDVSAQCGARLSATVVHHR